ncbi:MAG: hypothetical protein GXY44_11230, partial [Phycisphaerales bacterium]|nr:hypothetical protein [Phycisphaerales bacterium]
MSQAKCFVIICISFVFVADLLADSKSGSNGTNYEYTAYNQWIWSPISISGAPEGSTITSIVVHWNVDSNYISDIQWYLDNSTGYESPYYDDMVKTGDDWLDGYSETSDASKIIYPPANTQVNGTWWFNIRDTYNDSNAEWNKGRIDSWDITINYIQRPKEGDILGADPDSFTGSAKTVTVTVKNTGRDDANLIVEASSWPSGWSISPTSKQTNVPYDTTNSSYYTFTVTPPSYNSSGNITWKLYYDDPWPTSNTLLDTYSQGVTNSVVCADFYVQSINLSPSSPTSGSSFTATVVVKNQGTCSADGGWL